MLLMELRIGIGLRPEVVGEIERRGRRMSEPGAARISKRCRVDFHCPVLEVDAREMYRRRPWRGVRETVRVFE